MLSWPAGGSTRRYTMAWVRPGWTAVALLLVYFAVPVTWDSSPTRIGISLALTVAGLVLLAGMMVLEVRAVRDGMTRRSDRAVVLMLMLVVVTSAMTFYLMELSDPDQMSGLRTRTDALYFTLSTMATVGYGDVHATGQAARAVVCALIVFTAVVVVSLVRTHTRLGRARD
ncbi:two pore domain potassium channel family protein [Aeromicrobium sp. SMF47]|uniref:Two pore domain potassium channel family protein n=2 Tax=Aeromicrobium yanjiei TaxID=2662028 RepID=A0A5Q2MN26_9ACTN|nr:two pore domain potassium channel family protein [Aeromicrobium yanjiei]QGG41370.1 two pore domain potassium channel family protein [Aeromicrobium yanjiei]